MQRLRALTLALSLVWPIAIQAEDMAGRVKKAAEKSTLDQAGTKPFHLKAVLTPSFDRDKNSGRTGDVEFWWASPQKWKREIRSPEFHQIEIVNGSRHSQQNEGDFIPEWLREAAVELVCPIPSLEQVLTQIKKAEDLHMFGQANVDWVTPTGTADAPNIQRSSIALSDNTGLLSFDFGFGWGAEFKDYRSFHGRMIAYQVSLGSPQVTAKVTMLEDLNDPPANLFDIDGKEGDSQLLYTQLIDEVSLRKNLLPMAPISWPPLQDGALQGNVATYVVIDRDGRVREFGDFVSENSAINEAGREAASKMRFKPFVVNGVPVQVMSQLTLPFKTVRPAGTEAFESARSYFEHGRQVSYLSAGSGKPYVLNAIFELNVDGVTKKGHYEDTWMSASQWRREATIENSRYARARDGDKSYELDEGRDVQLLRLVFRIIEPIPATDTFQESDWRIKRDTVNNSPAVRVLSGYESPEGKLDAEQARGYWFNNSGVLVKSHFNGLESFRSDFSEFSGINIAHQINVLRDGKVGMRIRITDLATAGEVPSKTFQIKGHDWKHAFTDETR